MYRTPRCSVKAQQLEKELRGLVDEDVREVALGHARRDERRRGARRADDDGGVEELQLAHRVARKLACARDSNA